MKHIPLHTTLTVRIERRGPSGDYIAYPERYTPPKNQPEVGIHLDYGTEGDIIRVEIRSRQNGFIEAEPVEPSKPDGLHVIWNDNFGDHTETIPQQPRGPREASHADTTKRHREVMGHLNRRFRYRRPTHASSIDTHPHY